MAQEYSKAYCRKAAAKLDLHSTSGRTASPSGRYTPGNFRLRRHKAILLCALFVFLHIFLFGSELRVPLAQQVLPRVVLLGLLSFLLLLSGRATTHLLGQATFLQTAKADQALLQRVVICEALDSLTCT